MMSVIEFFKKKKKRDNGLPGDVGQHRLDLVVPGKLGFEVQLGTPVTRDGRRRQPALLLVKIATGQEVGQRAGESTPTAGQPIPQSADVHARRPLECGLDRRRVQDRLGQGAVAMDLKFRATLGGDRVDRALRAAPFLLDAYRLDQTFGLQSVQHAVEGTDLDPTPLLDAALLGSTPNLVAMQRATDEQSEDRTAEPDWRLSCD